MNKDFDYNLLPHAFTHCLNSQCKKGETCLRYKAAQHIPAELKKISIVNPAQVALVGEDCPFFKADELQQFALGMTNLLRHVPHEDAVIIKRQMRDYFGRSHYYRLWRKERMFSPEQQEYVRQLFLQRGLQEPPKFDEYVNQYEW